MKPIALQKVAEFCGGRLMGDGARLVTQVSTDSRRIGLNDVFVALVGDRFDGHDFLLQVEAAGASAVIISREPPEALNCAVIQVEDTLAALQRLASAYREWHDPLVVGVTGSNGKTSTKDFLCAVLGARHQVWATPGNLNNHIGLPLSILGLREGDTCAVLEMGMNHPGEIAPLAAIAKPSAAVITNVGVAHIEHMGSRDAIALEKGMLAEAIPTDGIVVLNANDEYSPSIASRCSARVLQAGLGQGDVFASEVKTGAAGMTFTLHFGNETIAATLPVPGEHMVGNAVLAAALGWSLGVQPEEVVSTLSAAKLTGGRLQIRPINGLLFLDDSYNANPDSMKAGLRTLAAMESTGRKVAILGHMGELGEHAEAGHREVGEYAAKLGLEVFTIGDAASEIHHAASSVSSKGVRHFAGHADCANFLKTYLSRNDLVLLKGSRSAGMERVLNLYQTA